MKLRNKKTGKIYTACNICFGESIDDLENTEWKSLKDFCEDWEDVKEPLIKDPKIRKVVSLWAEVNDFEPEYEVKYSLNCFSLNSWQANIEFNTAIEGLEDGRKYTIAELCRKEEE